MSEATSTAYPFALKGLAVGIFAVSLIHILFGVGAEPLLGAQISDASLNDPSLDSQNRFYGAAFSLFGAVWWIASADVGRYRSILNVSFLVFFLAGLSRVLAVFAVGWPSAPILVLTAIELILPPLMYFWLLRIDPIKAATRT